MAKIKSFGERIADALVEDGLLGANQVEELLEQQKKEGARLVKLVVEKAYVSEADLAVCMGRVLNVTPINIARVNILPELIELFPRETMHNHKVIPISRLENADSYLSAWFAQDYSHLQAMSRLLFALQIS